jgi:hypothetical protein
MPYLHIFTNKHKWTLIIALWVLNGTFCANEMKKVIPAKAGIQAFYQRFLDSCPRFHGGDNLAQE